MWIKYCSETKAFALVGIQLRNHFISLMFPMRSTFDHLDIFRSGYSNDEAFQCESNHGKCQLPIHIAVHQSSISVVKLDFFFLFPWKQGWALRRTWLITGWGRIWKYTFHWSISNEYYPPSNQNGKLGTGKQDSLRELALKVSLGIRFQWLNSEFLFKI